jgi:hypothetical protein
MISPLKQAVRNYIFSIIFKILRSGGIDDEQDL